MIKILTPTPTSLFSALVISCKIQAWIVASDGAKSGRRLSNFLTTTTKLNAMPIFCRRPDHVAAFSLTCLAVKYAVIMILAIQKSHAPPFTSFHCSLFFGMSRDTGLHGDPVVAPTLWERDTGSYQQPDRLRSLLPVSASSYLPAGFRLAFLAHLDSHSVNHKSSGISSRRMKGTLYRCILSRSISSCCASNRVVFSCMYVFKSFQMTLVAECPVLAHLERGIIKAFHCFVVGRRKRAETAVCSRF